MAYEIGQFAPCFVVECSKINCVDEDLVTYLECFRNDKANEEIFKCVNLMLEYYKNITDEIGIKEFKSRLVLISKEFYVKRVVANCLKLSEGDVTFFEFLLVCVYICRISECIYKKYRCCKILKLTADCLDFVYSRKYWFYFVNNGGFQGFADFCRGINNCKPSVKNEDGDCITLFPKAIIDPKRNEKVKILGCLKDADDVISLNRMERRKITMNEGYFIPSRNQDADFLITLLDGESKDKEVEGFEVVDEKTNKTGIRCDYCYAKCGQYRKDLLRMLQKMK